MHVHRTKRGRILEFWVLLFIDVRPYRCGKCRLRFYGPKKFSDTEGARDDAEFDAPDQAAPPSQSESKPSRSSGH